MLAEKLKRTIFLALAPRWFQNVVYIFVSKLLAMIDNLYYLPFALNYFLCSATNQLHWAIKMVFWKVGLKLGFQVL